MRAGNTRQRYDQIYELPERFCRCGRSPGNSTTNLKTVRRYSGADGVDSLPAGGLPASVRDSFKPYLHERSPTASGLSLTVPTWIRPEPK